MDYGNQVTKDTLRQILNNLPNTAENVNVQNRLVSLISSKTIQPIPYTYNAVYWVTGAANALAAGAVNVPVNVNIQADADFLILTQTYDCNTANAARNSNSLVIPNASVILTDTGSGYQMMDQAVSVPNIFGSGQFPFVLPQPKLMPAKSTLQVLMSNYDAAAGYNIRLSFNGVKLYAYN